MEAQVAQQVNIPLAKGEGKKPSTKSFTGTIASVTQELASGDRKYRIIKVENLKSETESFAIAQKFYMRNADLLVLDANVEVTYQVTEAGVTTWIDGTGTAQFHKTSGNSVTGITRLSSKKSRIDDFNNIIGNVIQKHEGDTALIGVYANAYAQLLR